MASQLDTLDAKIAVLMLKASLDYNAAVQGLTAQILAVGNEGKAIKFRHVQREIKRLSDNYTRVLNELIKEANPDENAGNDSQQT